MTSALIFVATVIAVGLILPRRGQHLPPPPKGYGISFSVFVMCVAFSPVIGYYIAYLAGYGSNPDYGLAFLWVGVGSSLPLSTATARLAFGLDVNLFLEHLARPSNSSKKTVVVLWAVVVSLLLVFGIYVLASQ